MPNTVLFKQGIYIEILSLDRKGTPSNLLESMALTIPPESIRVRQGQRITKTPTPGGLFVDNYGLDTSSISISGSTGNWENRLTVVGPGRIPRLFDGQEAFFELRDRIVRYSLKSQEYTMRLYDLTHRKSKNIFLSERNKKKYNDAWEVVLDDFTVDRGKARPFFYDITMEFTGIRPVAEFNPLAANTFIDTIGDILDFIDEVNSAIENALALFNLLSTTLFDVINQITSIIDGLQNLTNLMASFTNSFLEYQSQLEGILTGVINRTEDIINDGIQIVAFPYNILSTVQKSANTVYLEAQSLVQTINSGGAYIEDIYSWDKNDISSTGEIDSTIQAIVDSIAPIVEIAKQTSSQDPIAGVYVQGELTQIYSYQGYTLKENTTLERLSLDYYGSPDFKDIIAATNEIYSNDEIISGEKILIPVLTPDTRVLSNQIYNAPQDQGDIFGRDISLNINGNLQFQSSGDYKTTQGPDTVAQSIYIKLSEEKGRQIRNQSLGVYGVIGSALGGDVPIDLLTTSLRETLLQDPRILDVFDLNAIINGDSLTQEFKYITIDQIEREYTPEGI